LLTGGRLEKKEIEQLLSFHAREIANKDKTVYCDTIAEFLESKISGITQISKAFQLLDKANVGLAIKEYMERGDLESKAMNFSDSEFANNDTVQIADDVWTEVPIFGDIFISYKNGKKIIINLLLDTFDAPCKVRIFARKEDIEIAKSIISYLDDFLKVRNIYRNKIITPQGEFLKVGSYTFDDLLIKEKDKEMLKMNTIDILDKIEIYKKNNIPLRRGFLLSGPAGVGKTLAIKIICSELKGKATIIWLTAANMSKAFIMKKAFDLARELSPSVIIMEDLDLLFQDRETGEGTVPTMLGELLNQLDGLVENDQMIVLGTTNYIKKIEKALKNRLNRFNRIIEFSLPDEEIRLKMLNLYTKDLRLESIDLGEFARKTKEFTGAQLKELVQTASIYAIDQNSLDKDGKVIILKDHFDYSFANTPKEREKEALGFSSDESELAYSCRH
jgi:SpoVK/Ycf46/Vps4 family AAA+-type ATPase